MAVDEGDRGVSWPRGSRGPRIALRSSWNTREAAETARRAVVGGAVIAHVDGPVEFPYLVVVLGCDARKTA